ncbi:MAG: hypothetical protein WDO19_32950 [Bacteroidota bacterium]
MIIWKRDSQNINFNVQSLQDPETEYMQQDMRKASKMGESISRKASGY